MKNLYLLFLFTFSLSISTFAQNLKLPIPTKSFLSESKKYDNADVEYFTKYLGKGSRKILKRFDESNEICSSIYTFKNGIVVKNNSCSEAGIETQIIFKGYDKNEVVKFVEWFFKTKDNQWNKSKTKYEPFENDAGCYFEIKTTKNQIVLHYYCGC
ncbi:hypothetical protein [Flavobacterium humi]|uniref:Uncharacterized protein n=1 Tax=Flavobacterium humi TaxID=2562683 RepID=A0A4Z0L9J6_9FLAO|nr:hypothetical protein [Flavobacterium humi]TGD57859.1 hypothetical protein E4635_07550 [Flavobacterium humi]